jgi:signal transduction histidine kinase
MPSSTLRPLRLRLAAWYMGSFAGVLLLVGGGLFAATARDVERRLERSLRDATLEVDRGARLEIADGVAPAEAARAALDELTIPGRDLYLFDARGRLATPDSVDEPVSRAAWAALRAGSAYRRYETGDGKRWRIYARRFVVPRGGRFAAVAVGDAAEAERQWAALLERFGVGAFAALLLVGAVSVRLVEISVAPVQRTLDEMRRFLADAAHELRTPVAVLRGRAEVALQRERDPNEYREALQGVAREAERMGRLVDDLLALARTQSGERAVERGPLYLDDVVSDATASVRVLAEQVGVRVHVGEFGEAAVFGDAALLRQAVLILLHNALKFTPAGGEVRVDVSASEGAATLVVEDTGVGIDAAELPHVFDRFYRGAAARGKVEGAGLGLSILRWITDANGARVTLSSTPGKGTRAVVVFPPPPRGVTTP